MKEIREDRKEEERNKKGKGKVATLFREIRVPKPANILEVHSFESSMKLHIHRHDLFFTICCWSTRWTQ